MQLRLTNQTFHRPARDAPAESSASVLPLLWADAKPASRRRSGRSVRAAAI